jgi:SSS family solute:Na+ symporter
MLLGLLLPFRRSGPSAVIACWITGVVTFGVIKFFPNVHWFGLGPHYENALTVGAPMLFSLVSYLGVGLIAPSRRPASQAFLVALDTGSIFSAPIHVSSSHSTFEKK